MMSRQRFDLPRFEAAIRFALGILVVNTAALALFPTGPAPTFASFAVVSALYFLDYDGSFGERLRAYALSTLIGLIGIAIGLAVAGTLWAVCLAALLIGFCFAAARAFRGFIARSFIGAQLAFVLTVVTHDPRGSADELFIGWIFGSAIALGAALLLFPKQHSGQLRRALADWCRAAAELSRGSKRDALLQAWSELEQIDRQHEIAGLWSKRTRALAEMVRAAEQATLYAAEHSIASNPSPANQALLSAAADGFDAAADIVLRKQPRSAPSLEAARQVHEAAILAESRGQSSAVTVDAAVAALPIRVLSLDADTLIRLSAISQGQAAPSDAALNPAETTPAAERIRSVFRADSLWLFNGLRTGIALSAALAVALSMGLEHGVWVVMAALALINVSATTRGASSDALSTVLAVAAGVVISAGIIALHLPWAVALAVLAVTALAAKWLLPGKLFWAQLSYTPFAILNVAILSWPSPHGLDAVRIEDITIGVAVAVAATALAFPFGMRKLLERTWLNAHTVTSAALAHATAAFVTGNAVSSTDHARLRQAVDRMNDEADAVRIDRSPAGSPLAQQRTEWLLLVQFCFSAIYRFAHQRLGRPLPEEIAAVFEPGTAHATRIERLEHSAADDTEALVLASWAAAGLDLLAAIEERGSALLQ